MPNSHSTADSNPTDPVAMSALERRSSLTLASIYGLRMLGLFLILPVFVVYARHLPNASTTLVGVALGIYGLGQAIMQIPLGAASDRFGRKPVIVFGLLLFAAGSFLAGATGNLYIIIAGRVLQGMGAISAAISALIADSTREHNRTKAMALVGITIGMSFIIALVAGPALDHVIGVPGIFVLTGVLALLAIAVVIWIVPDVPMTIHAEETQGHWARDVFTAPLLRLDFSIFVVNFLQVGLFVVVPVALIRHAGIPLRDHWMVYLPVTVLSFVLAVPGIIWAERHGHMKPVFLGAVALLALSMLGMAVAYDHPVGLIAALFFFFIGFNVMEALLPSLVSRTAPPARKGLALGVYSTGQSLGIFAGGLVSGLLAQHLGRPAVFFAGAILAAVWFVVAGSIQPPARRHAAPASGRTAP
ncbi:MAG: MFS transporter [Gammaproteobacteria bacterium]|nr:MFS transporter [Gammaproteobacteria bacterium]